GASPPATVADGEVEDPAGRRLRERGDAGAAGYAPTRGRIPPPSRPDPRPGLVPLGEREGAQVDPAQEPVLPDRGPAEPPEVRHESRPVDPRQSAPALDAQPDVLPERVDAHPRHGLDLGVDP